MKKKKIVFGLFLFTALVALSIPGATIASDTQYEANNVTIQMGTDESKLNFGWLTTDPTAPQLVVCKEVDLEDGEFPESADYYDVEIEEVMAEESSGGGGGPGGGGPGPSNASTITLTATDEENDTTTYSCKVTIKDLVENTTYAYAIGNGENFSDINYFSTKGSKNYNFIYVGDPQIGAGSTDSDSEGWATTVTTALTTFGDTSFILSSGDQVESSTSDSQYEGFFSASELTSIPLAPANGNHDKSVLYSYHFNVPNESDLGQLESTSEDGDTLYYGGDYWFTYGKTLFMVLNTNNSSATSHSEFIAQAIEANPNTIWRVVDFHHSLYSSAKHVSDVSTLRDDLVPVMDEHDIDVVLAGHDHFYARTYQLSDGETDEEDLSVDDKGRVIDPSGTVYFTADSASGSKYYDFSYIEGYTNYYLAAYDQPGVPSYLNVEVNELSYGDTFTVSAYITESGEMIDTYTILKKNYDLNGDGTINRADVYVIRSLLRQPASVNPAADVDNDGTITILDARKLILMINT